MKKILHYSILIVLVLLHIQCSDDTAENENFNRKALLSSWNENIFKPKLSDLKIAGSNLNESANELLTSPELGKLEVVKNKWQELLMQWEKSQYLIYGPLKYTLKDADIGLWPINPVDIQDFLLNSENLMLSDIESLGANKKGIFGLEYVLFSFSENDILNDENKLKYIALVSENIKDASSDLGNIWISQKSDDFINNTSNFSNSPIPQTCNQLIAYTDHVKSIKIGVPAGLMTTSVVDPDKLELIYSKLSLEAIKANLEMIRLVFSSGEQQLGFDDFLNAQGNVGNDLQDSILNQISHIEDLLNGMNSPLYDNWNLEPAKNAELYEAWKDLIRYMKSDMISLLNITLTFTDADGD